MTNTDTYTDTYTNSDITLQMNTLTVNNNKNAFETIEYLKVSKCSKFIYNYRWLLYTSLVIYISLVSIGIIISFIMFDNLYKFTNNKSKDTLIYLVFIASDLMCAFIILPYIIIKNQHYYNKFKNNIRYNIFLELQNKNNTN